MKLRTKQKDKSKVDNVKSLTEKTNLQTYRDKHNAKLEWQLKNGYVWERNGKVRTLKKA